MRFILVISSVAFLGLSACSKSDASNAAATTSGDNASASNQQSAGGVANANAKLANVKPCELLTDEEIATQVDQTYEASQRAAMHARNVTHKISKQEDRSGMGPVCHFSWSSVDPTGDERAKGSFDLAVMTAQQLKGFEGMSRPKKGKRSEPINGIGDEAFYLEYAPSARVGDLGVSIAEFPDTHEGNGGEALLRAAAQRLH